MKKDGEFTRQDEANDGGAISLSGLLITLWHARWLLIGVTATTVVLGLFGAAYLARYRSEGFVQFGGAIPLQKEKTEKEKAKREKAEAGEPGKNEKETKEVSSGIMFTDYKRFAATFSASGRFSEFVQQYKLQGTAGIDDLSKKFASGGGIAKLVEPVYSFSRLDAKELIEQPKDSSNDVIGLHINYEADNPEQAQRIVGLLGRYTLDSIVYLIYSDALRFKHAEIMTRITKLDNDIIDNKEKLNGYQRQGTSLKQITARYPESSKQAARQIISVTEYNARYLSPTTHLMATEIEASKAQEAIHMAKREQQQNLLLLEYYDRAKTLLNTNKSGEAILRGLEPVKESVFKGKNLNDDLVKEVYNTITIENQSAISLYLEKSRFIAGPSLPENRTTRLLTVLVTSFLLGLLASIILVFGRNWWIENRPQMAN